MSSSKICILNSNSSSSSNPTTTESENHLENCGIHIKIDKQSIREPDIVLYFKGTLSNQSYFMYSLHVNTPEEIIIQLYKKYGIDYTLELLTGNFICILFDYYYKYETSKLYIIQDNFGMIPLYTHRSPSSDAFPTYTISSEKPFDTLDLHSVCNRPGTYDVYELPSKISVKWQYVQTVTHYKLPGNVLLLNHDPSNHAMDDEMNKEILVNCIQNIIQKLCENNPCISKKNPFTSALTSTESENMDMFEFDRKIRNELYRHESGSLDMNTLYIFYEKEFVSFYFSIPIQIRYQYRNTLFSFSSTNCH